MLVNVVGSPDVRELDGGAVVVGRSLAMADSVTVEGAVVPVVPEVGAPNTRAAIAAAGELEVAAVASSGTSSPGPEVALVVGIAELVVAELCGAVPTERSARALVVDVGSSPELL